MPRTNPEESRSNLKKVGAGDTAVDLVLGSPSGADGSEVAEAGTSSAARAAAGRPAGRAGHQRHLARSARINSLSNANRNSRCPGWGARHNRPLPEPEGREAMGNQAKPCEATGTFWVMRCYVKARRAAANLPLPGCVTFARCALTRTLTGNPAQRVCLGRVRPAEWSRNEDGTRQGFGRVAAEWMRNAVGGTVLTLHADTPRHRSRPLHRR
jgi:hypothetical protein